MTGLVVVITGAYQQEGLEGVAITSYAFASVIDWFPYVLSIAVFFFAFSTMISWSYYGERCVTYLFGEKASMPYKLFFCLCVVFGSVVKLGNVLDFSDLMILGMAFPNILGLFILSSTVREKLDHYWGRLQSGEMKSRFAKRLLFFCPNTKMLVTHATAPAIKQGSQCMPKPTGTEQNKRTQSPQRSVHRAVEFSHVRCGRNRCLHWTTRWCRKWGNSGPPMAPLSTAAETASVISMSAPALMHKGNGQRH